jgi:uncharacterized protein
MLVLLSPSKTQRFGEIIRVDQQLPLFRNEALLLVEVLKKLSIARLVKLLGTTKDIATQTKAKLAAFGTHDNSQQAAAFAFAGETYIGLNPKELSKDSLRWANEHLLLFSGLYGLLRPLDTIEPYRLDIKNPLRIPKYGSLTAFWKNRLQEYLQSHDHSSLVLNLSSSEYSSLLNPDQFVQWIDIAFLEQDGRKLTSKTVFSKRARGMMARFVVEQQVTDPADLLRFATAGYRYNSKLSTPNRLVFVRKST